MGDQKCNKTDKDRMEDGETSQQKGSNPHKEKLNLVC